MQRTEFYVVLNDKGEFLCYDNEWGCYYFHERFENCTKYETSQDAQHFLDTDAEIEISSTDPRSCFITRVRVTLEFI